jgi:hypothetical protein
MRTSITSVALPANDFIAASSAELDVTVAAGLEAAAHVVLVDDGERRVAPLLVERMGDDLRAAEALFPTTSGACATRRKRIVDAAPGSCRAKPSAPFLESASSTAPPGMVKRSGASADEAGWRFALNVCFALSGVTS